MLFFSRKHSLVKSGFFDGFKDYHNHLLPGVDDGVQKIEESLAVLAYFEELKISEVTLTPHVMVGVNNTSDKVEATFKTLKNSYNGPIKLSLASEYMLDNNFEGHFNAGARLVDEKNILVETSYLSAPHDLDVMLYNIISTEVTPIIAHPERYLYMRMDEYHALKDCDYAFQLNLLSFTDAYGTRVAKKAFDLLENRMYNIIGTDLHSLSKFKSRLERIKLSSKHLDLLMELKSKGL